MTSPLSRAASNGPLSFVFSRTHNSMGMTFRRQCQRFLDANKDEYPEYLAEAARLLRPGGLLLADNVVRKGAILAPPVDDVMAQGAARFLEILSADPRFEAIVLQQVGIKGHDGLALARRL